MTTRRPQSACNSSRRPRISTVTSCAHCMKRWWWFSSAWPKRQPAATPKPSAPGRIFRTRLPSSSNSKREEIASGPGRGEVDQEATEGERIVGGDALREFLEPERHVLIWTPLGEKNIYPPDVDRNSWLGRLRRFLEFILGKA